jgi:hypothetical protein
MKNAARLDRTILDADELDKLVGRSVKDVKVNASDLLLLQRL